MRRKGFTLTELLVTLAVSGVILASILVMMVSISSFNQIRTEKTMINEELSLLETYVSEWFSEKDLSSVSAPDVSDTDMLSFGGEIASFDNLSNTLTLGEDVYNTRFVEGITFEKISSVIDGDLALIENDNLVKCTVYYSSENTTGTYVFMLLKRSDNPTVGET